MPDSGNIEVMDQQLFDADGDQMGLLKSLFEQMVTIRTVEQTLLNLFDKGLLRGTVHTCLGQEGVAAGVVGALDKTRDAICSNHRGHGHYIAYCGDILGLIAEVMGLPQGVCGGRGGSQHLQRDNFYSNGILGGMSPVAAGIAFAEKAKGSGGVTVTFHGDGAMAEGAIYETLNLAALWKLPLLIAVENNMYAQSTPIEQEIAGDLGARGEPFGVPTSTVDGNDVIAVYNEANRLINKIRAGGGPRMLVLRTYRLGPHSKGDDDRAKEEINARQKTCPITNARAGLDQSWCLRVEQTAADQVRSIVAELTQDHR